MTTLVDEIVGVLQKSGLRFALAGGQAVSLHGFVRGTVDVDLILPFEKEAFVGAERALKSIGLMPRLPVTAEQVFDFRQDYIDNRNLKAWSFVDSSDPTRLVDILIEHDLDRFTVEKKGVYPVISRSELIAMKRAAGRPQDIADAKALEDL